jgi:uncharacterized protein
LGRACDKGTSHTGYCHAARRKRGLSSRRAPPEDEAIEILDRLFVRRRATSEQVKVCHTDCYKRLLSVSMETEVQLATKGG